MISALLVDFNDSFTWNVVQEVEEIGIKTDVMEWEDFETLPSHDLLILGPGPGHPDDYQRIFPLIREWLNLKRPLFGICLGHQIFWRILGEEVLRSKFPVHGQKVKLELTPTWIEWLGVQDNVLVQRYNSLAVPAQAALRNPDIKNIIQDGEIMLSFGEKVLTYQFHPESVGTTYRRSFFMPLLRYLV